MEKSKRGNGTLWCRVGSWNDDESEEKVKLLRTPMKKRRHKSRWCSSRFGIGDTATTALCIHSSPLLIHALGSCSTFFLLCAASIDGPTVQFRRAQRGDSDTLASTPGPRTTAACRTSALKPSTTSFSSTLHAALLAASPHSPNATISPVASRQCSSGMRAGTARRARWRGARAAAESAHSAGDRYSNTCVRRFSAPTTRTRWCTTRSFSTLCASGQAARYRCAHCSDTARRSWERDAHVDSREQQRRVSTHTQERGCEHACVTRCR